MTHLQGPTTARETSFAQAFGRDLHEAREACRRYRAYGEMSELNKAWDIYYGVRWLERNFIRSVIDLVPNLGIQKSGETTTSTHYARLAIRVSSAVKGTEPRTCRAWYVPVHFAASCFRTMDRQQVPIRVANL